jgi:hypothetical protein
MPAATTLISVEEFRAMFRIPSDVDDAQLKGPLASAARELKSWVGNDTYNDAVSNDAAQNPDRRTELDYAEGLLAMGFAAVDLNLNLSADGFKKTEKEEGSVVVQNLLPKEAAELQEQFFAKAARVAEPYRVKQETQAVSALMPTFFAVGRGRRGEW